MIALHTVLCPVDFSSATPRQIDLAADLCRAFRAKLVLHHNRHWLGTGASVGWMWNADHHGEPAVTLEARMGECLARVPKDVAVESLMTAGPVSRAVLAVGEAINADLVVLTAHGTLADDHASITERVLEQGQCPVLVLHEPAVEPRTPHFASRQAERQVVLAPTDLTPESRAALQWGFELSRTLPIELHLLHLLPNGRRHHDDSMIEQALNQLRALVPGELVDRVRLHVEHGEPSTGIPEAAERLGAACIVMGEHARTPIRRWFSRDTSLAVLHRAHCPIWYVPGARTPAWRNRAAAATATAMLALALAGCSSMEPVAVRAGDACFRCGRVIEDTRLAAQLVGENGQNSSFRTAGCLAKYLQTNEDDTRRIFVTDYPSGTLIPVANATFVRATIDEKTRERDFYAYRSVTAAASRARDEHGAVVDWSMVRAIVGAEKEKKGN